MSVTVTTVLKEKAVASEKSCHGHIAFHEHDSHHKDGHKHHHHHHHNHAMDWTDILADGTHVKYIAALTLCLNIVLMLTKCAVGTQVHSLSLLAEASHALSDSVSDVLALACLYKSRKQPTDKYPFGYAKLEPICSFLSSIMLLVTSVGIGLQAISQSIRTFFPHFEEWIQFLLSWLSFLHHDHHHHHHHDHADHVHVSNMSAILLIIFSMLAKEAMYHILHKTARSSGSSVLEASALHQRMESLGSAMSLLTILGTSIGYTWLDPLGGMVRAIHNGKDAWALLFSSVEQLCDCSASQDRVQAVREQFNQAKCLASQCSDVADFTWSDLIVAKHGAGLAVFVTLSFSPHITLKKAVAAETWLRNKLRNHDFHVRKLRGGSMHGQRVLKLTQYVQITILRIKLDVLNVVE